MRQPKPEKNEIIPSHQIVGFGGAAAPSEESETPAETVTTPVDEEDGA